MKKEQIINTLTSLVEGKISPSNWISWWNSNLNDLEKILPRTTFLKIKPNASHGESRATLISQNAAFEYLNKEGISVEKSDVYTKEWNSEFENYLKQTDKDDKAVRKQFKKDFIELESAYPKLFKCLGKYLSSDDKVLAGKDELEIIEKEKELSYTFSPELKRFFSLISTISVEGASIEFQSIRKIEVGSEQYVLLGDLWLENDGDMVLLKVDSADDEVYYYNHASRPIKTKLLSMHFESFIEKELVEFIKETYED